MSKKNKVKKCPNLWFPTVYGILAIVFAAVAYWLNFIGGRRIDSMSQSNLSMMIGLSVLFAALCVWRVIAYKRYKKKNSALVVHG